MPEAFKNLFNETMIENMAIHFKRHWQPFDQQGFVAFASNELEALELKQRSDQIVQALVQYLPDDYLHAGEIMLASLGESLSEDVSADAVNDTGIAGWGIMPMADYVGLYGYEHFDFSMTLFREMTKYFSSEFGIRFFLLKDSERTMDTLRLWAADGNQHVRRLISEGTRPRLPWAMRLPMFIENPEPVIDLLELLKNDKHEYVRRSVANNLNDIAKDHPDRVCELVEQWIKDADKVCLKMLKHACRTLIKDGHKRTLQLFGYTEPLVKDVEISIENTTVVFGDAVNLELKIKSDDRQKQPLMIDYVIHHRKANGSTSPKVFKWRTATLEAGKELTITKKHTIKKITTRRYYPGLHRIEVMINGISLAVADFDLVME